MAGDLDLRGVWIPLITPFAADGSVDIDAIERLCTEYLDAGVTGIVALGTTGEPTALDAAEKQAVVDTCARVCSQRGAPLIIGTGTNSTAATIGATQAIAGTPALAAALVVVPYYVRPSEAGIVEHFKAVAAASSVPIVVYNIPYRTGRALGSAALLELAATDNVVGLKQSVGALDVDTLTVIRDAPRGFHVLSGEDSILYPMVLMGAYGGISAPAHVCTARFVEMVECALAGKLDDGRAHAEALLPVVQAGFVEPNPAVWKGVLHAQGKIASPALRLPMTAAAPATIDACLAAIAASSAESSGRAR
ncbi:MAG TPA: 4-hydroxy-tetrahydrodipicolinate synthase [Acidimicrobiia bacterium]|nr:4-hydroxy-tetrahydrodipicolinate synthase [Acidimicrobiia bacterium]